jgi:hypothetical protein
MFFLFIITTVFVRINTEYCKSHDQCVIITWPPYFRGRWIFWSNFAHHYSYE